MSLAALYSLRNLAARWKGSSEARCRKSSDVSAAGTVYLCVGPRGGGEMTRQYKIDVSSHFFLERAKDTGRCDAKATLVVYSTSSITIKRD